ncbi:hypothetical protein GJ496_007256 [Pomphorhynchus laevis]|nr:hypothetical protein GJ496_007256 [Pomphorhynchus laevis]
MMSSTYCLLLLLQCKQQFRVQELLRHRRYFPVTHILHVVTTTTTTRHWRMPTEMNLLLLNDDDDDISIVYIICSDVVCAYFCLADNMRYLQLQHQFGRVNVLHSVEAAVSKTTEIFSAFAAATASTHYLTLDFNNAPAPSTQQQATTTSINSTTTTTAAVTSNAVSSHCRRHCAFITTTNGHRCYFCGDDITGLDSHSTQYNNRSIDDATESQDRSLAAISCIDESVVADRENICCRKCCHLCYYRHHCSTNSDIATANNALTDTTTGADVGLLRTMATKKAAVNEQPASPNNTNSGLAAASIDTEASTELTKRRRFLLDAFAAAAAAAPSTAILHQHSTDERKQLALLPTSAYTFGNGDEGHDNRRIYCAGPHANNDDSDGRLLNSYQCNEMCCFLQQCQQAQRRHSQNFAYDQLPQFQDKWKDCYARCFAAYHLLETTDRQQAKIIQLKSNNQIKEFNPLTPPASPPSTTTFKAPINHLPLKQQSQQNTYSPATTGAIVKTGNVSTVSTGSSTSHTELPSPSQGISSESSPSRLTQRSTTGHQQLQGDDRHTQMATANAVGTEMRRTELRESTCRERSHCRGTSNQTGRVVNRKNERHRWDSDETLSSAGSDISDDSDMDEQLGPMQFANESAKSITTRHFAPSPRLHQSTNDFVAADCLLARQRFRRALLQRKIQRSDMLIDRFANIGSWKQALLHGDENKFVKPQSQAVEQSPACKDIANSFEEASMSSSSSKAKHQNEIYRRLLSRLYDDDSDTDNGDQRTNVERLSSAGSLKDTTCKKINQRKQRVKKSRDTTSSASSTNWIATTRQRPLDTIKRRRQFGNETCRTSFFCTMLEQLYS